MSALVYVSSKAASQQTQRLWKHALGLVFCFVLLMVLSGIAVIEVSIAYPSYANELTFTNKKHTCQ